ncbi:MAG: DNA polymerase III subunit delta, partial [Myxococcales bacterium]|nr:DNA polymerase III subunit delta [Myxococcales bacterium]
MTPEALRQELASGTLRPAYLVVGTEPLLRDDAVAAVREATLGDAPADFNFDRLDGAKTTPAALMDVLRSLPVMAPRRLVVLRDPEPRRGAAKALPEAIAEAVGLLEADGETVLVVVAEKVDGRARWVKAFGAKARVDCDPPKRSRELVNFVKAESKRQQVSLASGAAELLAERVGPHLLMLRNEISKASLLAGLGKKVTRDHVATSTSDIAEEPTWESVVQPMIEIDDRINRAWSPVAHLNAVADNPRLREAYNAALPLLSEYATEMGQNDRLYKSYRRIAETKGLNPSQQKVLANAMRDFRLAGVDLA